MRIKDIEYIPRIKDFTLLAGGKGLNHRIRNVVIFEYEDKKDHEPDYYHDDFIITSLIFAKDNPSLLEPMLKKMIDLGASGIAIKRAYYDTIPESITTYAEKQNIPIFMFRDIFIEDVIVSISNYMQNERRYSLYQQEIHDCITSIYAATGVEKLSRNMNSAFLGYTYTIYIEDRTDSSILDKILKNLLMRSNVENRKSFSFYQYKNGLFIIYNTRDYIKKTDIFRIFTILLEDFGCSINNCVCGLSTYITSMEEFDRCFRESYFAYIYSIKNQLNLSYYEDINTYHILLPMLFNPDCKRTISKTMNLFKLHEKELSFSPSNTINAYFKCNFNISETAVLLCQHPNTIRYRIRRLMELADIHSEYEFQLRCTLISLQTELVSYL